ncbi:MAG TPA: hypothetical protein VK922_14900 [Gemmatimonadaceae bacterium]|nr:hypothetical protein [Gemmatimonadaceae bacterium]
MRSSVLVRGSALGLIAAFTASCADAPTAPEAIPSISFDYSIGFDAGHAGGQARLCKVGTSATFSMDDGTSVTDLGTLADGACITVASGFVSPDAVVTITETSATPDSIVKITGLFGRLGGPLLVNATSPDTTTITGTSSATANYGIESGTVLIFYNTPAPPPGGGEGCTPGYWRQSHHFDSYPAGYAPTMLFVDAFGVNAFPGKTLAQVAALGGGGLNALGRHAVAALLNAASPGVDYDLSEAEVISAFAAAYASGNYETQKNIFEGFNEQGCPLN